MTVVREGRDLYLSIDLGLNDLSVASESRVTGSRRLHELARSDHQIIRP